MRPTPALGSVLCLALSSLGCSINVPGGGPESPGGGGGGGGGGKTDDPYLAYSMLMSLVSIPALGAEIAATAMDDLAFRPSVHVALAAWGAGHVTLGTVSGIRNRDQGNFLVGPIFAGVTGLPLFVMSIYNLVTDSPPPRINTRCLGVHCRAIPHPLLMFDVRGAPTPGLQLVQARF